jgi:hypothetical protein
MLVEKLEEEFLVGSLRDSALGRGVELCHQSRVDWLRELEAERNRGEYVLGAGQGGLLQILFHQLCETGDEGSDFNIRIRFCWSLVARV